jgi:hypothetical protein
MTMAFGEDCLVENAARYLSGRTPPWPDCDQRETRLTMRVRDVVTALMRCRSGLRREAPLADGMIERAMQAAEENTGRAPVWFVRHRQSCGIEPAVGPMIVVGELPEMIDAHRIPSRGSAPSLPRFRLPKW